MEKENVILKVDFENWLGNLKCKVYKHTTVSNYISYLKKIWDNSLSCQQLMEYYTVENNNEKNLSDREIEDGVRALKLYIDFLEDKRLPALKTSTEWLNELAVEISTFLKQVDFSKYLYDLINKNQITKSGIITNLQTGLLESFKRKFKEFNFIAEEKFLEGFKDRVDILGVSNSSVIIIELDKYDASQMAKKTVARIGGVLDCSLKEKYQNKSICYVSLCYPGTKNMNKNECVKYMHFNENICRAIDKSKLDISYMGFIIESQKSNI